MSLPSLRALALGAVLLAAPHVAAAQPAYQQPPAHVSGVESYDTFLAADNFILGHDLSLSRIDWWGGTSGPGVPGPDAFTIRIFADAGGVPGAVLQAYTVGDAHSEATGDWVVQPPPPGTWWPVAVPEYHYRTDLLVPLHLTANTRYWISIANQPWPGWVWERSSDSATPGLLRGYFDSWWMEPGDLAFGLAPSGETAPAPSLLYALGAFGGFGAFAVDPASGTTTPLPASVRPLGLGAAMAVAPSGPFLYVVSGWPSMVEGFAVDFATGALRPIAGSPFPIGGTSPVAVTVDGSGRFLYVANNVSADISAFRIDPATGALTPVPGQPFPAQAMAARSLAADPLGDFLYFTSGGLAVWRIDHETGALAPSPRLPDQPDGTMAAAHPSGRFVYAVDEVSRVVSGYAIDRATGALSRVPASPYPVDGPARTIAVGPGGRFVFVGCGDGLVQAFAVDSTTGALTRVGGAMPAGSSVHSSVMEPSGHILYSADAGVPWGPTGGIWAYRVDQATGALTTVEGSPLTSVPDAVDLVVVGGGPGRVDLPPAAAAGPDLTLECDGTSGTAVRLDGSGSSDPEGGPLTYEWRFADGTIAGSTAAVDLTLGCGRQHILTLTVTDTGGMTAADVITVTIAAAPFYEQPAGHASGFGSDEGLLTADDFAVDRDAMLFRVDWWGGYEVGTAPGPDDFTIRVFSDDGGRPGLIVAAYLAGAGVQRAGTGSSIGPLPEYRYSYGLPAPLHLDAGTRYWVSIDNQPGWRWEAAAGSASPGLARGGPGRWRNEPGGAAFSLSETFSAAARDPFPSFLYVFGAFGDLQAFTVDPAASTTTPLAGSLRLNASNGIAVAPAGPFLYSAGGFPSAVEGFLVDPSTGTLRPLPGSPFAIAGTAPIAVTVDGTGRFLYVANNVSADISAYRIDPVTGGLTPVPGQPFPAPSMQLNSLVADPLGDFLYSTTPFLAVWRIDRETGALTSIPRFPNQPDGGGAAADPSGRFVYALDPFSPAVSGYAVDRATGGLTSLSGTPFAIGSPGRSITVDPTGRFVYVGGADGSVLAFTIDSTTGSLTAAGSPVAPGESPFAMFVEPSGHVLYTAEFGMPPSGGAVWARRIDQAAGTLANLVGSPFAFTNPIAFVAVAKGPARNLPPAAEAGPDATVECASPAGTPVHLDGSASSDPEGAPLSYEWRDQDGLVMGSTAALDVPLPPGHHVLTLTVTDSGGLTASDVVVVTIVDTIAPRLTISVSPDVLWPPDGRLVPITATVGVADACDATAAVMLLAITSDDETPLPEDIQAAVAGTDDREFLLRAFRDGEAIAGRTYTIVYEARDASGNRVLRTTSVLVPHDER